MGYIWEQSEINKWEVTILPHPTGKGLFSWILEGFWEGSFSNKSMNLDDHKLSKHWINKITKIEQKKWKLIQNQQKQ